MNYNVFKLTELQNNFYTYIVSPFDDTELTMETFEHFVSNSPQLLMCQYLMICDFDNMTIEKVNMNPIDVINKNFLANDKNMLISDSFKSLIPPPKPKREPKKKAEKEPKEKKEPKPRGKKCVNVAESVPVQTN